MDTDHESENLLSSDFRLENVHTIEHLKREAHPVVSVSVLLGGLAVALILVFMQKTIAATENLILTSSQDTIDFYENLE